MINIAVINEVSASHRNQDILEALKIIDDINIFNVGMKEPDEKPELTYIQTGIMSAILLNAGICDMVIGGCGTGQGYMNSVMQFPGVFCGLITNPLDAWLFSQINGGNCISLALNKGYGWAGDINLQQIFREFFRDSPSRGYPPQRRESQAQSRDILKLISGAAHLRMEDIIKKIDKDIVRPILKCRAFMDLLMAESGKTQAAENIAKELNRI